jgi:hypothetical protein
MEGTSELQRLNSDMKISLIARPDVLSQEYIRPKVLYSHLE